MSRQRATQLPDYAVADEAAAYIADALMDLALQFEATHFAQIRRYTRSIAPVPGGDEGQLDLFGKCPLPSKHRKRPSPAGSQPHPAVDPLVANDGRAASSVKADSRRRRGPPGQP
jgi:hypothetical protein